MLRKKIAATFAALALSVGVGLAAASPAAAEQPNMYVITNAGQENGGIGGSIAVKNCAGCSEYLFGPGNWRAYSERGDYPHYVMAGNSYCVEERVRIARNTDPNNREWYYAARKLHGGGGARQPSLLLGFQYLSERQESVESRLTIFRCE